MGEYHDEQTLFKVRDALLRVGAGESTTDMAIKEMLNAGILFRELGPDGIQIKEEIEQIRVLSEEILLNTDQAIRVQALDMAVNSAVRGASGTDAIVGRAEIFEDYIKNGVQDA